MKSIKFIFLGVLLLFPVLIYLFLQGFGKNEFEIPIFHQEGVEMLYECDSLRTSTQYFVELERVSMVFPEWEIKGKTLVLDLGNITNSEIQNNVNSFLEKYKRNPNVLLLSLGNLAEDCEESKYANWKCSTLSDDELKNIAQCELRIAESMANQLVLIDSERRIRGYYNPTELSEIDRLNTEIHILLNN